MENITKRACWEILEIETHTENNGLGLMDAVLVLHDQLKADKEFEFTFGLEELNFDDNEYSAEIVTNDGKHHIYMHLQENENQWHTIIQ